MVPIPSPATHLKHPSLSTSPNPSTPISPLRSQPLNATPSSSLPRTLHPRSFATGVASARATTASFSVTWTEQVEYVMRRADGKENACVRMWVCRLESLVRRAVRAEESVSVDVSADGRAGGMVGCSRFRFFGCGMFLTVMGDGRDKMGISSRPRIPLPLQLGSSNNPVTFANRGSSGFKARKSVFGSTVTRLSACAIWIIFWRVLDLVGSLSQAKIRDEEEEDVPERRAARWVVLFPGAAQASIMSPMGASFGEERRSWAGKQEALSCRMSSPDLYAGVFVISTSGCRAMRLGMQSSM